MADPVVFHNGFFAWSTSTGSVASAAPVGLKSLTIPISRAELDDATMGDDISATYPGILTAPLSAVYKQNFAAGAVDALSWGRFNAKTMFRVKARSVNAAVSTTNPSYIWNRVYIVSVTPISGGHGEPLMNNVEFRPASGCTVTRSTST